MSVPRGWGGGGERGLRGIPMEGCLLKWIGVGFWHMEKDDQCAYCPFLNLPAHFEQANQSLLFTF